MSLNVGYVKFLDMLDKGKLITFEQFVQRTDRLSKEQFGPIRAFVSRLTDTVSKFESLLISGMLFKKSLSRMYTLLI